MTPSATLIVSAVLVTTLLPSMRADAQLTYPTSRRDDQVDVYFGTPVADPYRWLEDESSAETKRWVEEQNALTFAWLEKIPYRAKLRARLQALIDYPRYGAPFRKGDYYVFSKNDGLQNQSVLYVQRGLDGTPELLLDPNKFSVDGTSTLAGFALSHDGRYAAYGISKGGSDWHDLHVMEVVAAPAARPHSLGQGHGDRLAGRWLLLQPLRRAGFRHRADRKERRTQGLLPSHRNGAGRGRAGLRGSGEPTTIPYRGHDGG
jgi:Serine proteases of the peptidase family S9A